MQDDAPETNREVSSVWRLLPPQLRSLPADLAAVLGITLLTDLVVLLPIVRDTSLRVVLGLPFILFLPGYAFVAALFPDRGPNRGSKRTEGPSSGRISGRRGIDYIERIALSFGLSIATVPLLGLGLNYTPWGIRVAPILLTVSLFTLVMAAIAVHRRNELPPEDRFRVPYNRWASSLRSDVFDPETRTDAAVNLLLVVSIVLAVASVGYALTVPDQGEAFTEFYLLTETEDGELVASGYPTEFAPGESKPVVIGIGNREHEPTAYTIVVKLERVRFGNNTTTVHESRELDRFRTPRIASNETWERRYTITPSLVGNRLRLVFLLYIDSAPQTATIENAYRETHLWINVTG